MTSATHHLAHEPSSVDLAAGAVARGSPALADIGVQRLKSNPSHRINVEGNASC